jgi:hypothetical protein
VQAPHFNEQGGQTDATEWPVSTAALGIESFNLRADLAELEVSEIIAGIRFDDADMIAPIETHLGILIDANAQAVKTSGSASV